jgi:hypothetical protein
MSKPFIGNHQFNLIRKQANLLVQAFRAASAPHVAESVRDDAFVSGDESGALAPGIRAVFLLVFAVMALTLPRLLRMPAVSGRELFGGRQSAGERQD